MRPKSYPCCQTSSYFSLLCILFDIMSNKRNICSILCILNQFVMKYTLTRSQAYKLSFAEMCYMKTQACMDEKKDNTLLCQWVRLA